MLNCPICGESFPDETERTYHIEQNHPERTEQQVRQWLASMEPELKRMWMVQEVLRVLERLPSPSSPKIDVIARKLERMTGKKARDMVKDFQPLLITTMVALIPDSKLDEAMLAFLRRGDGEA